MGICQWAHLWDLLDLHHCFDSCRFARPQTGPGLSRYYFLQRWARAFFSWRIIVLAIFNKTVRAVALIRVSLIAFTISERSLILLAPHALYLPLTGFLLYRSLEFWSSTLSRFYFGCIAISAIVRKCPPLLFCPQAVGMHHLFSEALGSCEFPFQPITFASALLYFSKSSCKSLISNYFVLNALFEIFWILKIRFTWQFNKFFEVGHVGNLYYFNFGKYLPVPS